ncbi:ABC transporter substrate-binding protein [Vibrio sinaloensis]|uniref:ABC transporter substrate-binding protein n=1 Tax=Photobacterium sp. (strain ATCC 43367) TaxID=379097 RepID=UPI0012E0C300
MENMLLLQRKSFWLGSVCLFLIGATGYFLLSKQKGEMSTVRVGVSLTPTASPFLIAERLKLFEKYSLDVSLFPCVSGSACTQLMLDHNVDYATASESVVMFQSHEHNELALLVSFVESDNDLKLLTLGPNNIRKVAQLKGKRVGLIKGTASEFYFDSILLANDLKGLDVEKVYLDANDLVPALLSYRVEAISAWEPMGYQANLHSAAEVINLGTRGVYQLSFNLLSTTPYLEFVGDEPTRLLSALNEAIQWININPEQARILVAERLNIPVNQVEWSWQDYVFRLSLGNSLLSNLQFQARWADEAGLVAGPNPDFRDVFYSRPYQQATLQRY